MLITPEGWGGNFFNAWRRTSNQFELLPVYKFPRKTAWGRHELKVGADLTHRSYLGANQSHPILLLRQDGSLDEQIAFQGGSRLQAQDTEVAEFVQDHWLVTDHLALDLGSRFSSQSIGRSAAFAPRAGLVYAPGENGKTIIRAGAGLFYDRFWPRIFWRTRHESRTSTTRQGLCTSRRRFFKTPTWPGAPMVCLSRPDAISTSARATSPQTLRLTASLGMVWSSAPAISTARLRISISLLRSTVHPVEARCLD
jgi:hypothetical protein